MKFQRKKRSAHSSLHCLSVALALHQNCVVNLTRLLLIKDGFLNQDNAYSVLNL